MRKVFLILFLLIIFAIPACAHKNYYIETDEKYNTKFLCFSEKECYYVIPEIIKIQDKKFVGFGGHHYYDINTYKYNKKTHSYSVDILVNRDPFTDLDVCNKCPYDKGNITHLIFSLKYKPLTKKFNATYKGFVSSEDIMEYENNKPIANYINYLNIYYNNNSNYIQDLSDWLSFFNKRVPKSLGKPNSAIYYDVEIEYIIPYNIRQREI